MIDRRLLEDRGPEFGGLYGLGCRRGVGQGELHIRQAGAYAHGFDTERLQGIRTGEILLGSPVQERGILGDGAHLVGRGSSVFYLAEKGDKKYEVGTVDTGSLELKPRFTFSQKEAGSPRFFLAVSPDRIILVDLGGPVTGCSAQDYDLREPIDDVDDMDTRGL